MAKEKKKICGCQILMGNGKYISWNIPGIKEYKAIKDKIRKAKAGDLIEFGPTIALRKGSIDCVEYYEGDEANDQRKN